MESERGCEGPTLGRQCVIVIEGKYYSDTEESVVNRATHIARKSRAAQHTSQVYAPTRSIFQDSAMQS